MLTLFLFIGSYFLGVIITCVISLVISLAMDPEKDIKGVGLLGIFWPLTWVVATVCLTILGVWLLFRGIKSIISKRVKERKKRQELTERAYKLMQDRGMTTEDFLRQLMKVKTEADFKDKGLEERSKEKAMLHQVMQKLSLADENFLTAFEKSTICNKV